MKTRKRTVIGKEQIEKSRLEMTLSFIHLTSDVFNFN